MESKRRYFLSILTCLVVLAPLHRAHALDRDPIRLTHGPMLGNPTATSVRVWGRTSDPGQFVAKYGTAADRLDQTSQPATTEIDHDNTGFDNAQRVSSRTRVITIRSGSTIDPTVCPERFARCPAPKHRKTPNTIRKACSTFVFRSVRVRTRIRCTESGIARQPTRHLNRDWADKVHFHIMNGDWLYEELRELSARSLAADAGRRPISASVVQVMPTIVGVWENYKLYLCRGVELAKWHRNVPSYFTFDDHELVNDIWGSVRSGQTTSPDRVSRHRHVRLVQLSRLGQPDGAQTPDPLWHGRSMTGGQRSAGRSRTPTSRSCRWTKC